MGLFLDVGYVSLNKKGEELCGDKVEIIRNGEEMTIVLADGLGSGVKANILATLTSKILCMLAANKIPLEECVNTIIGTLPVCKVRGVAYSTFTLLHINTAGVGYLVEFDNPLSFLLSEGKYYDFDRKLHIIQDKNIYITNIKLKAEDSVIFMSDGAVHAGIGMYMNFGWERKDIIDSIERAYEPKMSPRCLASIIGDNCRLLYDNQPGDDTTIVAIKVREEVAINIMVGAPIDKEDDERIVKAFLDSSAKKIVCGGTTSQIVARYLNEAVETDYNYISRDIPPIGMIKGIDLTTEGVLTLGKLLEIIKKYLDISNVDVKKFSDKDGASLLANILFEEATHVKFFVGRSINNAHAGLPIDTAMKLKLVEKIAENLKSLGKEVTIEYC
ncbi:MAG: SpoIIE family protein phosphatase [Bacilli bacterium]|nr:SpoIIE family protein phosphatase [Bacilli bacterium]